MVLDPIPERLARAKSSDGGYGSVPGAPPEPEPTAMAALALGDPDAVAWLVSNQAVDGSFGMTAGSVVSDHTAVVSLSLPAGASRERALDHVESVTGTNSAAGPQEPPYGWPWTDGAYGWTEPTAWGVLALRINRSGSPRIADGLDVLRSRECPGGGWNYGTPVSFGVDQPPFAQTTAVALFATNGLDPALTKRGQAMLAARWRAEAGGLLTLATATAAFRALGDPLLTQAAALLERDVQADRSADTVALAWSALALGRGLDEAVAS